MRRKRISPTLKALMVLLTAGLACNVTAQAPSVVPTAEPTLMPAGESQTATVEPPTPTDTPEVTPTVMHQMTPAAAGQGKLVYDVESKSTSAEKRAPYGDSYDINRLERPFDQDMTYHADVDVVTYNVGEDSDWWYVSINVIGADPNSAPGINYGIELDRDHDGFGDDAIVGHAPYPAEWDTLPVRIFHDSNHDTSGLSAEKSDAPIDTDGYDEIIFNGGPGDADADMAWVRYIAGNAATIQFAFKKSWAGSVFMLGVFADAGLKDPGMLDYVDRFTEAEAGSPVKEKQHYPLGALYLVDNVCRAAFGFTPTGFEPQLCPTEPPPTATAAPTGTPLTLPPPVICPGPPPGGCPAPSVWSPGLCTCVALCLSTGTQIDTPNGPARVESLRPGDAVWTMDASGTRVAAPVVKVSQVPAAAGQVIVHVVLSDGREAWVSPGHPTADGRTFGDLAAGDALDGARVEMAELVPYAGPATYDVLPAGGTGSYWANGILMGSTLLQP